MSLFRKISCLLIVFSLAFFIQSAVAQENADSKKDDEFMLEELIVTAEKHAADVQDVSIAMSVISNQEINKQSVIDMGGMISLVPELNFRPDTIFNSFTIRGVGSYDNGELADQAITLAVDGEYINRPVAMNATMFDIERVEVLRGPQGTLYGKNATGGAINIIANKPKDKFEASLFAEFGNYSAIKTRGMINAPLSDSFFARAAFMTSDRDGYIDGGPAGDIPDEGVKAGRLSFLYEPNERLSWYVAGEMSKVDQDAPVQYGLPVGELAPAGFSPADLDVPLPKDFDVATAGFVNSDQYAIRTQLDYDLNFADFSYVAGYRNVDVDGYQPLNGFVPETFSFDNHLAYETQSHELLLQKEADKMFVQGGFFFGYETQYVARGLFLPMAGGGYLNFFLRDIESTTYGVFAQGSYDATDTVKLTAGVRNTWDEKKRKAADAVPFYMPNGFSYPNPPTSFDQPGTTVPNIPSEGDWSQLTWLVGVDWQVTPENLLFAKISTGYKAGGFDNIGSYDPELLTAYEVGSKNRFLDNTLQLNLSAFFYDYTDQQTTVFISTEVGHGVQNAGSTETYGVEADMEWLLTTADRFTAKVRYLNSEFQDLPTQANVVGAASVDVNLKGNTPVQSPEWTLSLGYDHSWAFIWGELTANVKTNYKSKYYLQPFNWKMDTQDAYTMTDASLTFASFYGNWDITAYVHNMEDERLLTFSAFTGDGIDVYNWIFGTPRTYGVQFRYRWGQ